MILKIEDVLESGKDENTWYDFSEETMAEFKTTVKLLKRTEAYLYRIDWFLSADDSEDTFHIRLKADLEKLNEDEN